MGAKVVLFSRPDCELCDYAAALASQIGVDVEYRDISGNVDLLRRYGNKIPVLKDADSGRELEYPFGVAKLKAWLQGCE